MIQPYFEVFCSLLGGELQIIEDSSLVILGYQLLPLATSKLMGDNKEINNSAIFEVFYLWLGYENFRTLKMHHWLTWLPNAAPSNQSEYAKLQSYLMCFAV